jgi:hypothetical protein
MMTNKYFHEEQDEFGCGEGRKSSNKITFDDKLVIGVYISFMAAFSVILCYGVL